MDFLGIMGYLPGKVQALWDNNCLTGKLIENSEVIILSGILLFSVLYFAYSIFSPYIKQVLMHKIGIMLLLSRHFLALMLKNNLPC